ncbi:glycosyltransferase [Aeribacillus sp. FSL K6-2848]|uniref:glycosyltransferase n=1 Tax=Aeribacillus sp. FSL K6-2848 TaxID=2954612 RepID=UPI0030FCB94F
MIRVWMYPKKSPENKYNELLSTSLEREKIEVLDFNWANLFKLKRNDIIHFHWIQGIYQSNFKFLMVIKLTIMLFILLYLKFKNVRLVWTVHNLYPHEYKFKFLEKVSRKLFMSFCNKLIVASESLKNKVIDEFKIKEDKILVIPHGHYRDAYKSIGKDFRGIYGIPKSSFVFLFLGQIRPYKGVINLIETFQELYNSQKDVYLVVAGKPSEDMRRAIKNLNINNKNIILDLRFIPDEEIVDLLSCADVLVLPYEEITTSGSAILGISFYKVVVSPATPFLKEYLDEKTSVLYDSSKEGLKAALLKAQNLKYDIRNFEKILSNLEWKDIAKKTIACYKNIQN